MGSVASYFENEQDTETDNKQCINCVSKCFSNELQQNFFFMEQSDVRKKCKFFDYLYPYLGNIKQQIGMHQITDSDNNLLISQIKKKQMSYLYGCLSQNEQQLRELQTTTLQLIAQGSDKYKVPMVLKGSYSFRIFLLNFMNFEDDPALKKELLEMFGPDSDLDFQINAEHMHDVPIYIDNIIAIILSICQDENIKKVFKFYEDNGQKQCQIANIKQRDDEDEKNPENDIQKIVPGYTLQGTKIDVTDPDHLDEQHTYAKHKIKMVVVDGDEIAQLHRKGSNNEEINKALKNSFFSISSYSKLYVKESDQSFNLIRLFVMSKYNYYQFEYLDFAFKVNNQYDDQIKKISENNQYFFIQSPFAFVKDGIDQLLHQKISEKKFVKILYKIIISYKILMSQLSEKYSIIDGKENFRELIQIILKSLQLGAIFDLILKNVKMCTGITESQIDKNCGKILQQTQFLKQKNTVFGEKNGSPQYY